MGKIIVTDDFIDLGAITSRSEATGYADDNVEDYWHLKRRFRADDVTDTDWLLKCNLGAAKSVEAIVLCDVNFDHVQFQLHAADAWGAPDHDSGDLTISQFDVTKRYNIIYIPAAAVTKQWIRVYIPNTASPVGDYTTKWEVGALVVLDTATALSKNMSYGYSRTAEKAFETIRLPHGGHEVVKLGSDLKAVIKAYFGYRTKAGEAELWTLNAMSPGDPLIFFENDGDTSAVYLCTKDNAYEGEVVANNLVKGNAIQFTELI